MSDLHQEHHFESAICEHLGQNGWLYADGDAALYDKQNALFLPDLLAWIETTSRKAGSNSPRPTAPACPRYSPSGCANA